jgi:hypothetical protein
MSISEGTGRTSFSFVGLNITLAFATLVATTFFAAAFAVFLMDLGFVLVAIKSPLDYI